MNGTWNSGRVLTFATLAKYWSWIKTLIGRSIIGEPFQAPFDWQKMIGQKLLILISLEYFWYFSQNFEFFISATGQKRKNSCFSAWFPLWQFHVSLKITSFEQSRYLLTQVGPSWSKIWSEKFSKSIWIWQFIAGWGIYRLFEQVLLSKL